MKVCEICGIEYVPKSDQKTKYNLCSCDCYVQHNRHRKQRNEIDKGNYKSKNVGLIQLLGYKVTITKMEIKK